MSLEENVKEKVFSLGAEFVGIAPRSRFEFAPEYARPDRLLPKFRSVVAYGIAMDRGALEAYFSKASRRPIQLHMQLATDELNNISLHLARWLERQGNKSLYIAQNGYYHLYRGRPDFSHRHAAVAAGLGRLGLSSNFVHTQFAGAVHLASVITEAELDPDPMVTDEDNPCHQCKTCINICPVQAISQERTKTFFMEGQEYTHQWLNRIKCGWGCGGFAGHQYQIGKRTVGTWAYNDLPMPSNPDELRAKFIEANHFLRHPMELAEMQITNGTQYCGYCHKVCVGSKKDNAAMLKLHLNSGPVQIPDDPTMLLHLEDANTRLEKYRIPQR
jgi:epoxyqueuosine reductase QueG